MMLPEAPSSSQCLVTKGDIKKMWCPKAASLSVKLDFAVVVAYFRTTFGTR